MEIMSTCWNRVSVCTLCTELVGDVSMWVPSSERNSIRDRKGFIHQVTLFLNMIHCDESKTLRTVYLHRATVEPGRPRPCNNNHYDHGSFFRKENALKPKY